jgi:hypothetical protein
MSVSEATSSAPGSPPSGFDNTCKRLPVDRIAAPGWYVGFGTIAERRKRLLQLVDRPVREGNQMNAETARRLVALLRILERSPAPHSVLGDDAMLDAWFGLRSPVLPAGRS